MEQKDASDVIGLIAGDGRLPVVLAAAVKSRGHRLVCVMINGEQTELARLADHAYRVGFGELHRILEAFATHGVRRVLLTGRAPRERFLGGGDSAFRQWMEGSSDRRDHALFQQGVQRLAGLGIEVASPLEFVGDLLTPAGVLTRRSPTDEEWQDARAGIQVAKTIAALDIGQTLVLKRGIMLAVEAAEGTDETIRRGGAIAEGAVVVKASPPHQDERFDLPTAGVQTVYALRDARAAVLVLEAGHTLLVDRAETVAAADAAGIAIVGLEATGFGVRASNKVVERLEPPTPNPQHRIFVVAGEVSGDINAAHLVRELRRRDPSLSITGVGGQYLAAAGASLFLDSSLWGTIGWLRASQFTLIPKLLQIEREIRRAKPDLLLVVDFPAFNLHLAERLDGLVPIVYYFPPMVSVRRGDRARKVARLGMRLLAAFRREAAAYQAAGADVVFVGHPAVDLTKPQWTPAQARAHFELPEHAPVIGLLPGSRVAEITTHLPVMLRAADMLWRTSPELHFLIPLASEQFRALVTRHASSANFPVRVVTEPYDAMAISEVIVTATGTATLEAAVLAAPMVAVYRLPWLSWVIAHYVLTIRRAALPNILSGRDIVPELLQNRMTPDAIAKQVRLLLEDPTRRRQMQLSLREVASDLGTPGVVQRAADEVVAALARARVAAAPQGTIP